MSNRVCLEPCKFEDVRTGHVSYGYRMFDDYAKEYCNMLDSIPDDDFELLEKVVEYSDNAAAIEMLEYMKEFQVGITVGDVYYEWHQVEHILGVFDENSSHSHS